MDGDILEDLMPYLTDRLSRAYNKNSEYRQAVENESRIYEQLKEGLTDEQRRQLEGYFSATKETAGVCEKLAYQQGIKDLFSVCACIVSDRKGDME